MWEVRIVISGQNGDEALDVQEGDERGAGEWENLKFKTFGNVVEKVEFNVQRIGVGWSGRGC